MKKVIKIKKTKIYSGIAVFIIISLLFSAFLIVNKTNSALKEQEPKAKVLTDIGCLQLDDSISDFDKRQKFYQDIFGKSYVRCE